MGIYGYASCDTLLKTLVSGLVNYTIMKKSATKRPICTNKDKLCLSSYSTRLTCWVSQITLSGRMPGWMKMGWDR
jgi:hypothetical protein